MCRRVIAFSFLTLALSACSDGQHRNEAGVGPASSLNHAPEQCPQISGEVAREGGVNRKSFQTVPVENGIELVEDEKPWVIDGQEHPPKDAPQLVYKAACENEAVVIDLFDGPTYLGRMTYSYYSPKQLLIVTRALDSRIGKDARDVWDFKTEH